MRNGLLRSFSNSYNIQEPYPLHLNTRKFETIIQNSVKKGLMRIVLFRTYELLKLYIILCIFYVPIIFYICQTIHSFPKKFKSLPFKFLKCFLCNSDDKAVLSLFLMCILIVNVCIPR